MPRMKDKRPLPDDKVVLNRRRCRPLVESTDGTVNHYLHIIRVIVMIMN